MCGLNTSKYCGNKTEEYVITLFSSALYRYLPKVREMNYFVRIRENLLSGTPPVRIPVHNTTGWGHSNPGRRPLGGHSWAHRRVMKTGYLEKMVYLCTRFLEKHGKVYTVKISISGFY